jgi:hypothetical protein
MDMWLVGGLFIMIRGILFEDISVLGNANASQLLEEFYSRKFELAFSDE